ncbi:MAG: twitching motility protein PilT [Spirochaetes bacterium]|nr:twitching motility protein PilT [Spirochaetota bacterium]
MPSVTIRFYEELNDFLPAPHRRKLPFVVRFPPGCTVKAAIEDLGVPHTEVDLVLIDGQSVDFAHLLRDGQRISVYPVFESLDIAGLTKVRPEPLREMRFVADVHLGTLAGLLRMFGFDALFAKDRGDEDIARLSREQSRIVLTRDRGLLKRRIVTHGCLVRSLVPREQLSEVFARFDLRGPALRATGGSTGIFSRCMSCNEPLVRVEKSAALPLVPPRVAEAYEVFSRCPGCGKLYWRGTHWEKMRRLAEEVLGASPSLSP